jgi:hypothetical protein
VGSVVMCVLFKASIYTTQRVPQGLGGCFLYHLISICDTCTDANAQHANAQHANAQHANAQHTHRCTNRHNVERCNQRGKGSDGEFETKITFTIPAEIHKYGTTSSKPVPITRKLINILRDMPTLLSRAIKNGNTTSLTWSEGNLELIGYYITTGAKLVTSCKRAVFEVEITVKTNSEVDTLEKATDIIYSVFYFLRRDRFYLYMLVDPGEYLPYYFKPLDDPSNIQFQEDMYLLK